MLTKIGKINTNTQTHNSNPTNIKHLPKNNTKSRYHSIVIHRANQNQFLTKHQSTFINRQYTTNNRSSEQDNLFKNIWWVKRKYLKSTAKWYIFMCLPQSQQTTSSPSSTTDWTKCELWNFKRVRISQRLHEILFFEGGQWFFKGRIKEGKTGSEIFTGILWVLRKTGIFERGRSVRLKVVFNGPKRKNNHKETSNRWN